MAKFKELFEAIKQAGYQQASTQSILLNCLNSNADSAAVQVTAQNFQQEFSHRYASLLDDETNDDLLLYAAKSNDANLVDHIQSLLSPAQKLNYLNQLNLRAQEISRLSAQNEEQQIKIATSSEHIKKLVNQLATSEFNCSELRKQNENIQQALNTVITTNNDIAQQNESLTKINHELVDQNKKLSATNEELTAELAENKSLIQQLKEKLKKLWARLAISFLSLSAKKEKSQQASPLPNTPAPVLQTPQTIQPPSPVNDTPSITTYRSKPIFQRAILELQQHRIVLEQEKLKNQTIVKNQSTSKPARLWNERQIVIKDSKVKGINEVIQVLTTDTSRGADAIIGSVKLKYPLLFAGFTRCRTETKMRNVIQAENLVRLVLQ